MAPERKPFSVSKVGEGLLRAQEVEMPLEYFLEQF